MAFGAQKELDPIASLGARLYVDRRIEVSAGRAEQLWQIDDQVVALRKDSHRPRATWVARRFNAQRRRLRAALDSARFWGVRPDHGGRIELKLTEGSATSARYSLSVFLPDADLSTAVRIDSSSSALDLDEWQGGAPPEWLAAYTHALLRSLLRTKVSEGDWPRRVTRWRSAP